MKRTQGFTLAEVLITLAIIGVVAAMTIPTLMNATGQAEFKTGYKKAISVFNQAITMNMALDNTDFSTLTSGMTSGSIYYMFTTRMNVVKVGDNTDAVYDSGNYTFFFNDGMAISFLKGANNCTVKTWHDNSCYGLVDVNGNKKPNKQTDANAVKDQFAIRFYDQTVEPNSTPARNIMYN